MPPDKRPAPNGLTAPVKSTAPATRFPMTPKVPMTGRPADKQPRPPGGK